MRCVGAAPQGALPATDQHDGQFAHGGHARFARRGNGIFFARRQDNLWVIARSGSAPTFGHILRLIIPAATGGEFMRSIILWECLALLGTLFLCGAPANALVGGDLVDVSLQRYTVAIRSMKGGCTGVVLAQDIVLTAAHCTQNAQNLWVGGNRGWGSLNNPPVGLSAVTETVQHPRYNPDKAGSPRPRIAQARETVTR